MMNETFYTNGKNKFKNDEFDGNEWSAPYMVDVNEIKDRINSFNLVGRKIKNIRFIGLCYNLRREWIEEIAYNNATGSEEEKQKFSNYDSIPDELQYLRFAEIDEPLLIKFEDETESRNKLNTNPAHVMAITMIRDVLRTTGITATAGIGTNLYLAKVAMDIVAKKQPADKDGVRIAELNEDSYKFLLWDHKPLTDFWQIGNGKARRLEKAYMFTMGDIAARTQWDEEFFYKTFGIDGEILVDHRCRRHHPV